MIGAFFNDLAQRLITGNKWEQRRYLRRKLLPFAKEGGKLLDFGCGTGLFYPTIAGLGLRYFGFDVDGPSVQFAARRYPGGEFFSSRAELRSSGPYDLILANCCFHHIDDELLSAELDAIRSVLKPGGKFLLIDLLRPENDRSFLRAQFRRLERGAHIRSIPEFEKILAPHFVIHARESTTAHVLSISGNPLHNPLAVFECRGRAVSG